MMRSGESPESMAIRVANMVQADFVMAVDREDPTPHLMRNMIAGALLAFRGEVLYECAQLARGFEGGRVLPRYDWIAVREGIAQAILEKESGHGSSSRNPQSN